VREERRGSCCKHSYTTTRTHTTHTHKRMEAETLEPQLHERDAERMRDETRAKRRTRETHRLLRADTSVGVGNPHAELSRTLNDLLPLAEAHVACDLRSILPVVHHEDLCACERPLRGTKLRAHRGAHTRTRPHAGTRHAGTQTTRAHKAPRKRTNILHV